MRVSTANLLVTLPSSTWAELGKGIFATFLRVSVALAIALIWTVPVGVFIGTHRRLASVLQPIVQVVAAIPATALFPILLLALLRAPGGLNIAAVLLMLMGTQWYLLFNVIAGAVAGQLKPKEEVLGTQPGQPGVTRALPEASLSALAGLLEKPWKRAGEWISIGWAAIWCLSWMIFCRLSRRVSCWASLRSRGRSLTQPTRPDLCRGHHSGAQSIHRRARVKTARFYTA